MKTRDNKLHIKYVPIDDLVPSPFNPRHWSNKAREDLREGITRNGIVEPLLINIYPKRRNRIISGHFRWTIAKELGYKTVPVIFLNIPSEKKERELLLRMNANQGEWDFELLKSFDVDLLLDVGFDDTDLSHMWDESLETEDDNFDVEKAVTEIKKPKTKLGDIYQLGNHRLICGDSTNIEVVQTLVGNDKINMIYSDPPYNIKLDYNNGVGAKNGKYGGKTQDNKSDADYQAFLKKTLENGLAVSNKDTHIFYWCDERYIGLLQDLFKELGLDHKRVCLWLKDNQNPTPNIAFNKVYEAVVYATRGKPYLSTSVQNLNQVLNKEVGTGNKLQDDVLDLLNIWLVKRVNGADYKHPTEKPPTLHEKALRRCTKVGDIVLDLFGGSGSTLIAAEQLKRKAYLVEVEPIFCDVIIKRYETLTNSKAKKLN